MLVLTLVGGAERCEGKPTTVQVPAGRARFVIGRDPVCDWALPDRSLALSARHCEIVQGEHGAVLHDLSTNGSFINRSATRMVKEHRLRDGDQIEVGPYVIGVSMRATPAAPVKAVALPRASGPAGAPAPAPQSGGKSVEDTTPLVMPLGRGGDPAALALPAVADEDALGLTRIRPVPAPEAASAAKPAATPAPESASAPVAASGTMPAASPAPVAALPTSGGDRSAALHAPGPTPAAQAVERAAEQAAQMRVLMRAAVEVLRAQLARQARVRGDLGCGRAGALSQASPLQLAPDTDQALEWLLSGDPVARLGDVSAQLADHDERLLNAFEGAVGRLAADLSPQALARAVPGTDARAREALYAVLWQRLGLADADDDWDTGLRAAARQHLARAYDEGAT